MNKFYHFLIFLFISLLPLGAQDLNDIEVSILTCGSGTVSYELFGHSAIRVQIDKGKYDVVYNYGTFDFEAPGFNSKFLRGQLDYFLNRTTLDSFVRSYQRQGRWVKEQVLDLTDEQKKNIFSALEKNVKPENRFYKYDFFFDNCVTRIRDVLEKELGEINYGTSIDSNYSYRDLLHSHLKQTPWTEFGMDLILGARTDRVAGQRDQMFLPEYFFHYLSESKVEEQPLIGLERPIVDLPDLEVSNSLITPYRLFLFLFILELIVFFLFYISGDYDFMKWWDRIWFWGLFVVFIIFVFMWFLTDHEVCRDNYNLLWTVPWSCYALARRRKEKKLMFFLTLLVLTLVLLIWILIPQSMPAPIIFICLISILKSLRKVGFNRWLNRLRKSRGLTASILLLTLCSIGNAQEKIAGLTLVAPPRAFEGDPMIEVEAVNAQWIALVPFGFSRKGQPQVHWGSDRQWWGEREEGIEATIDLARKRGLKIMIKPQVWIPRGWVGDMDFDNEADWKVWEDSYRNYIMNFVDLAVKHNIELLCVGTEYEMCVRKREQYWRDLIAEIRTKYKGALTFSSNWDRYEDMPLWDALDYIGVSAYFPLSNMDTPMVMILDYKWNKYVKNLRKLSEKFNKQILFTEFGYLSVDGAAGKTWELESKVKSLPINEAAQANAYEALLSEFEDEDFWAGGFLWKWFPEGKGHEGYPERDYTPQNKKAESVISKWYEKLSGQ